MEIKSETNIVCDELDQRDLVSIKVERNHNDSVLHVSEFQRESSNIGGNVVAEDERENSITDTKENLSSIANEEEDIKNKDSNFAMETKELNCYSPSINTAKNATLIDGKSDIKPNVQKPSSSNLVKQSQVLGNKKITSHAEALNKETNDSRTNGITKLSLHDTEMTGQTVNDSKCTMCYKSIQCKHTTTDGKNSSKKFQCDVCGNWFKHTYTLRKHKCNHEGENKRKRSVSIITSSSDHINDSTNKSITGSCTNNSEVREAIDNGQIESVEPACDSAKQRPVTQSVIGPNEKKKSANKKQDASNKNISVKRRNKRTA
ncbi:unnamed protein product [Mytilus coruscus]|uniref:C2H2-type domain-containing protein n=1 Tax=Mytilus coruscus TaxID=42192 RepID=A0A6J8EWC4_MYTCO|nr:unnamed protein product [Mytilus coruscus]